MTAKVDLRQERVNRGLSIYSAGEQMGVDPQTLSRVERGEGVPVPRNAFKIASFYGYKVTDLWPVSEQEPAA